jgi:hypothetical protein
MQIARASRVVNQKTAEKNPLDASDFISFDLLLRKRQAGKPLIYDSL